MHGGIKNVEHSGARAPHRGAAEEVWRLSKPPDYSNMDTTDQIQR